MSKTPGLLIAFDGIDSSGKHTQVQQLITRLRFMGRVVKHLQSPEYTTPSGQKLKQLLQNKDDSWGTLSWEQKMKLFAANRLEHRDEVVTALKNGEVVVYDRYVISSLAFITLEALQAQETDLFRDKIQEVISRHEYDENNMPREAISIFLDVPPRVSSSLLESRKLQRSDDDEYTDHIDLQNRLYNEYDILCTAHPQRFLRLKCVIGGQLLPVTDVAALVWEGLRSRFPQLEKTLV